MLFEVTFEITNRDGHNGYALSKDQSIRVSIPVEAKNENQAEAFGLQRVKRALGKDFKVKRLKIKSIEKSKPGNKNTQLENKKKKGEDKYRRPPGGSPEKDKGKGQSKD